MNIENIKSSLPEDLYKVLSDNGVTELRPCQEKAINKGLLNDKSLLVCTPTASGKTLVGEISAIKSIMEGKGKTIYIVPLRSLAVEKYNEFKKKYESLIRMSLSIGDLDSADTYLSNYDLILCTSEKLDSLIRHHTPWLKYVNTLIIDEIHLLNDINRGPTLEVIITLLRDLIPNLQIIGLSATIGNPKTLAEWMNCDLVVDDWRPVNLSKGVYCKGEIEFR